MQVILLQRVEKLGQMGQLVDVKPGYARNFLLPKKKALRATKDNVEMFDNQKAQLELHNLKSRQDAEAMASKIKGTMITVITQASETGQMYGSVRQRDVSELLKEKGFTISRDQVSTETIIKTLGIHSVKIALHPEVSATIEVNVAKSSEEASVQAQAHKAAQNKDTNKSEAAAQ